MLLFFDVNYYGDPNDGYAIPLNIGIVSNSGFKFYGEFVKAPETYIGDIDGKDMLTSVKGEHEIEKELKSWLTKFDEVIFVTDFPYFEKVHTLYALLGGTRKLPNNVRKTVYDLNQIIDRSAYDIPAKYYTVNTEDINREDLCMSFYLRTPKGNKDTSLYNAELYKMIYKKVGR